MTTPYPPQVPKKLERSRSDKFVFGVCGGVARYLNLDPTLVRVLTVILTVFTGAPLIVYLVAAFVMPEETSPSAPSVYPAQPPVDAWTPSAYQPGPTAPADPVWGTAGAPWEQRPSDPRAAAPADPEAPVVPPAEGSFPADKPGDSPR